MMTDPSKSQETMEDIKTHMGIIASYNGNKSCKITKAARQRPSGQDKHKSVIMDDQKVIVSLYSCEKDRFNAG